ncbi:helix-turn-helix transcriptional regulator [Tenacibaculum sp. IB213877]|uniref:helix-turn-helix transcriptional regulator n=1 Tax=Tenacibaculum sp. IB213877 TaxID=3097351 RepID=UPI002A5AC7DD|nr:helix-turn-helix transcriptional regulator [Tenacibaculum sp. IB213877]MDY0780925.1 helix-turn-helix transcriptional regulator [Tenacibaculum sp. IB213877]
MKNNNYGTYSRSLVTDVPADLNTPIYKHYNEIIPQFEGEAVYVYSFKENKMLFTRGWLDVLGYHDDEITLFKIITSSSERHMAFSSELNDKGLQFVQSREKDHEKYSFTIEVEKIHKNGSVVPLLSRVGIFKAMNGQIVEIIGKSQIVPSLKFGKVMQYAAYGPNKSEFEETLSKELFQHFAISSKEKEALSMAAKGLAFKEIAGELNVSQSAIEKRILPLYKRFNVKSLPHLISFAYKNHIL